MTVLSHRACIGVSVQIWIGGEIRLTTLGVLVKNWLGGADLAGLIGQVDPMGKGQCGHIDG